MKHRQSVPILRPLSILLIAAWSIAAPSIGADPTVVFAVDDAWGRDVVQFRTSALLEDIVGTTNHVTGTLRADRTDLSGPGTQGRLEVEVGSLKTGIALRDTHVAKALGAEKHPTAIFTLDKLVPLSDNRLEPNVPIEATAQGRFALNGVSRAIDIPVRLTYIPSGGPFSQARPGNFVKLTAEFDVRLSDYGIDRKGPVLPLQVGQIARVTVAVLASDATPEETQAYRLSAVKILGTDRR